MKLFAIIVVLAIANVLADDKMMNKKEWEDIMKMEGKEWQMNGNNWGQVMKSMYGNKWEDEMKKKYGDKWEEEMKKMGGQKWEEEMKKMYCDKWQEQMKAMYINKWQEDMKKMYGNQWEEEMKTSYGNKWENEKKKMGDKKWEEEMKKRYGNKWQEEIQKMGDKKWEEEMKKMEEKKWEDRMGSEKYTDKYDSMDLDSIIENKRLMQAYSKCMLDQGKCTAEGKELKSHISEALQNYCGKCTESQMKGMKKVIKYYIEKEPDTWEQLCDKYDPQRTYSKKYEKELMSMKH